MRNEIDRRDFLVSLMLIPLGAAVAGCGEDKAAPPGSDASCDGIDGVSTEIDNHTHTICVAQAILDKPPKANVEITTDQVAEEHTHTITLTEEQITTLAEGSGALTLTTSEVYQHTHQFTLGVAGAGNDMG